MNKIIDFTSKRNEKEILRLIQKWIDVWNVKDKPFTGEGLEEIFAPDRRILFEIILDFRMRNLHSLQEYIDTFVPIMNNLSYWEIKLREDIEISVSYNLGASSFLWLDGIGKSKDGEKFKVIQNVTHTWIRPESEWKLVGEQLGFGKFPKSLL